MAKGRGINRARNHCPHRHDLGLPQFVLSIAAAWVITVPASALLAATIYGCFSFFDPR